tara:strand:- start:5653 stop:6348 length:696 start_codon:yes stop_codon:yes gene_type:complete
MFGGRRITFAILIAMGLFAAIPYTLINRFASVRDWAAFDPTLQLDIDIPFLAWMIVPYLTLYLYYPAAAWLGSKNEIMWRQNVVFHQMMLLTCWGVNAIFILLPVEIDLRHLIHGIEGTMWESSFVAMHAIDTPWNSWPSLHIVQSMQVVLVLRYWYPPSTTRLRMAHALLLIMWILLVISTMTIKQHYVWDVATAMLLAGLGWVYWMKPCLERLKTEEYIEQFDARMALD